MCCLSTWSTFCNCHNANIDQQNFQQNEIYKGKSPDFYYYDNKTTST